MICLFRIVVIQILTNKSSPIISDKIIIIAFAKGRIESSLRTGN